MFLLVFATAVSAIAADFGIRRWKDLMPYGVGAFALFGLGSLPAGRLGDLWDCRQMMLVFFFGMGAAMLLVAATQRPWRSHALARFRDAPGGRVRRRSLAVWALGPLVKAAGFETLLLVMAAIAIGTSIALAFLPTQVPTRIAEPLAASPARAAG